MVDIMNDFIKNPHPGDILKEEFLDEMGMSMRQLAADIDVPANRITQIVKGVRGITADTDLRLSRYFGLSEGYWLRLQNQYDLMEAKRKDTSIQKIKPVSHVKSRQ